MAKNVCWHEVLQTGLTLVNELLEDGVRALEGVREELGDVSVDHRRVI